MSTQPNRAAALRLASLLLGSGTLHFVRPQPFDRIVPRALPGDARAYTYASGVAELAVGTALVVPRTRRLGGALAAALFVAVFPANIQMAVSWWRSDRMSPAAKAIAGARLPLQIPLVTEAVKVWRGTGRRAS
ncbi:DoxX family protein [Rhodococcus phenolicus]|uniref:DoxX family protein n=1 Tax=Rhodococcus phenolicus TaxID=263849 RepID=UPI00082CB447|nr:MauE/DoxX family redox-associated membrane protein [Rhodococcus phenolicus]